VIRAKNIVFRGAIQNWSNFFETPCNYDTRLLTAVN